MAGAPALHSPGPDVTDFVVPTPLAADGLPPIIVPFGFLALGARDRRPGGRLGDRFEPVEGRWRIFRSLPGGGWRPPC